MFKREVISIGELVVRNLTVQGLATPLMQRRLIAAWPLLAGAAIARYTKEVYIQNQTLVVLLRRPALRADLSMRRQEFVKLLNDYIGQQLITDVRFS